MGSERGGGEVDEMGARSCGDVWLGVESIMNRSVRSEGARGAMSLPLHETFDGVLKSVYVGDYRKLVDGEWWDR